MLSKPPPQCRNRANFISKKLAQNAASTDLWICRVRAAAIADLRHRIHTAFPETKIKQHAYPLGIVREKRNRMVSRADPDPFFGRRLI